MQRAYNLLQQLHFQEPGFYKDFKKIEDYFEISFKETLIRLHISSLKTSFNLSGSLKENFKIKTGFQRVDLQVESPLAALFALGRLQKAVQAKRPFLLEATSPSCKDRIFWPVKGLLDSLKDLGSLELFCQRLIELGYNGVVLAEGDFCLIQSYGLKVYAQRNFEEMSLDEPADAVVWKLDLQHLPSLKQASFQERVIFQVQAIEKKLPLKKTLVVVLPPYFSKQKQNPAFFSALLDEVSERTKLAFLAYQGDFFDTFEGGHPFWEEVEKRKELGTFLMPMINAGGVELGEGLWPVLPFVSIDTYFGRLSSSHFSGGIVFAASLPKSSGLLDCSLWMASEALWSYQSSFKLAETWCLSKKPYRDFLLWKEPLFEVSLIAKELVRFKKSALSREVGKAFAEALLARLQLLQEEITLLGSQKEELPTFFEYIQFFIRDAKKIVFSIAHLASLSLSHKLDPSKEGLEGFWAQKEGGGGLFKLRELPFRGPSSSRMEKIFYENRLLPKPTF